MTVIGVVAEAAESRVAATPETIKKILALGYEVVFNKQELAAVSSSVEKLLGLFAYEDTFLDGPPAKTRAQQLPLYDENAPTFAEMIEASLRILSKNPKGFFLVAEEEGTDGAN